MTIDPLDPTDSVRRVLEQAPGPMSTEEIAEAVKEVHEEHVVTQALDFWHREHHAVMRDADGKWSWQGPTDG